MTLGRGKRWRGGGGGMLWKGVERQSYVCDGEVQVLCNKAVRELCFTGGARDCVALLVPNVGRGSIGNQASLVLLLPES